MTGDEIFAEMEIFQTDGNINAVNLSRFRQNYRTNLWSIQIWENNEIRRCRTFLGDTPAECWRKVKLKFNHVKVS